LREDDCEPWNNSYQRDGDTEALLRKLRAGPMTDDQIMRLCLSAKEIAALLNAETKTETDAKMIDGLMEFIASFGKSPAFGEAISSWLEDADEFRQQLDWSKLPPDLYAISKRRADHILNYAASNGWVERSEDQLSWQITEQGNRLLDSGGFYLR
jgi:hypothetical protein